MPPKGEIHNHPFGLLKSLEDMAVPTSLRPHWGCGTLNMANGIYNTHLFPVHTLLPSSPSWLVLFQLNLKFMIIYCFNDS